MQVESQVYYYEVKSSLNRFDPVNLTIGPSDKKELALLLIMVSADNIHG